MGAEFFAPSSLHSLGNPLCGPLTLYDGNIHSFEFEGIGLMLHAVIMAGGSGTRFWPESRRARPKQLLPLASDQTLLRETYARSASWIPPSSWRVVTNQQLAAESARQLPELAPAQIVGEPCGRNTAPCIALAARKLLKHDPDAVMLVMPADHAIHPPERFQEAVARAVAHVAEHPERLVLFGVPPTYPSTGYGYIERDAPLGNQAFSVKAFHEKPPREIAEQFLAGGRHYWNCGIFVWRADRILQLLAEHKPEIIALLDQLAPDLETQREAQALASLFPRMPSISIDHAVLEKARDVIVLEAPFEWDDVGSWQAVARLKGADADGNTIIGLHVGIETSDSVIQNDTPKHLIATIGVKNCVIVHTPDATLIARRDDENAIRELVALLEQRGYGSYL